MSGILEGVRDTVAGCFEDLSSVLKSRNKQQIEKVQKAALVVFLTCLVALALCLIIQNSPIDGTGFSIVFGLVGAGALILAIVKYYQSHQGNRLLTRVV
ncbi:MAG: hypothetical protein S4CHLAM123_03720 [Chlamydiales bacterium]|nr:hypothetical protein [Chlamydiales bacterium]